MIGISSFKKLAKKQEPFAGGKSGTLARLYRAGYRVPDGFIILPAAFVGDDLTMEAWALVQTHLARLRKDDKGGAFVVRSSALSEDSAQASFAGEFETVLDVRTDEEIRQAIHTVRRSRHNVRVQAYSQAQGLEEKEHEIAIVVQRLIRADFSGVLFTADPQKGALVTPAAAQTAQTLNPLIRVAQIPGAGHNIRRENFKAYMEAIREFLKTIDYSYLSEN